MRIQKRNGLLREKNKPINRGRKAMKYRENDIAYIVENNLRVTKVRVIRAAGGRCTVSPGEGIAMRLPEGRLYESAE